MRLPLTHGMFLVALASCLFALASPVSAGGKPEAARDGAIDQGFADVSLGAFEVERVGDKSVATYEYGHKARYLRLLVGALVLGEGDELVISGVDMSTTGQLNGQTFLGPVSIDEPFMTGLVYGETLKLKLTSSNLDGARLTIESFIYQEVPPDPLLSIFDNDDRVNFTEVADPELKALGRSVVFLAYMDGATPRVCSGFVLNPSMIMTNDHCVNTAEKCQTATIVFDYVMTDGSITMGQQRRCSAVKDGDGALDFAVLELDEQLQGVSPIPLAENETAPGVQTYLVQHPGGEHKQLAEVGCQVIDARSPGIDPASATDFTHRCDTIGGSSGSPVVVVASDAAAPNRIFCVTGLHHWGFEDGGDYATKNRAVTMSEILTKLKVEYVPCGN